MNQWFKRAKFILAIAGEFALFSLKSLFFRGMPRTEPGTFLRGDYEKTLNITYFCLSPLFIVAAICFGLTAMMIAFVSTAIGIVDGIREMITRQVKQSRANDEMYAPPVMVTTHAIVTTKLNEYPAPAAKVEAQPIPIEVPVDEEVEDSTSEYSSSPHSIEGPSMLGYLLQMIM